MKIVIAAVTLAVLIFVSGCTKQPAQPNSEPLVVQAYLHAGQPVNDIRLTTPIALFSQDSSGIPVNDAQIFLYKKNNRYQLIPNGKEQGFYYYPGKDLTVENGDEFELEINYQNNIVTATTKVPPAPLHLTASSDTLTIVSQIQPYSDKDNEVIKLEWTGKLNNGVFFLPVIENIDPNPKNINSIPINPNSRFFTEQGIFIGGKNNRHFFPFLSYSNSRPTFINGYHTFIKFPSAAAQFLITPQEITLTGNHLVRVYVINQEYADLLVSQDQNSGNLNPVLTNIKNGLGIFTAFSKSDSLSFYVQEVSTDLPGGP